MSPFLADVFSNWNPVITKIFLCFLKSSSRNRPKILISTLSSPSNWPQVGTPPHHTRSDTRSMKTQKSLLWHFSQKTYNLNLTMRKQKNTNWGTFYKTTDLYSSLMSRSRKTNKKRLSDNFKVKKTKQSWQINAKN